MITTKQAFQTLSVGLLAVLVIVAVRPGPVAAQDVGEAVTVQVTEGDEVGPYLTDAKGRSLYLFESDSEGNSTCYDACAEAWPPLATQGQVEAGEGVDAGKLDTITREDGTRQVTYNGWPLYYYAQDTQPGDIEGQDVEGFGAEWYLVSPEGEQVEGEGRNEQ